MNTSRGFISLVLLLVIIGIVVLGGAGYWASKKGATTGQSNEPIQASQTTNKIAPTTSAVFKPVAQGELLHTRGPISRTSDGISQTKFSYLYDGSSIFYAAHSVAYDLPEADLATFMVLSGSVLETDPYALDKNHVYYLGEVIPSADSATFHVLNGYSYSVDNHAVYWEGMTISGVDLATFVAGTSQDGTLGSAKDKNHLYCYGQTYALNSGKCSVPSH